MMGRLFGQNDISQVEGEQAEITGMPQANVYREIGRFSAEKPTTFSVNIFP
jgi:hypothetical protein